MAQSPPIAASSSNFSQNKAEDELIFDEEKCQTDDLEILSRCLVTAIKMGLVDKVLELNSRLMSYQDPDNEILYGTILSAMVENYRTEYNDIIVPIYKITAVEAPSIYILVTSENLDSIPFSVIKNMIAGNKDNTYFYPLLSNITYSLIRTNRIAEWMELFDHVFRYDPDISLSSNDNFGFIEDSLFRAVEYDRFDIIKRIIDQNYGNYDIQDSLFLSYAQLSNDSLFMEALSKNLSLRDLAFLLEGVLFVLSDGFEQQNDTKIQRGQDNFQLLIKNITERNLWSEFFSLERKRPRLYDSNPFYGELSRIIILPVGSNILNYILPTIINILDDEQRIQFDSLLKYLFRDEPSNKIGNISSAQILYNYLIPDSNGVRLNFEEIVPGILDSYFMLNPKGEEFRQSVTILDKKLLHDYLSWLSSLPGFWIGLLHNKYLTKAEILDVLLEFMDKFSYSYEGSEMKIIEGQGLKFIKIKFTIPIQRSVEDQDNHQYVLQESFKAMIVQTQYKVAIKLLSYITDRDKSIDIFVNRFDLDKDSFLTFHELLFS